MIFAKSGPRVPAMNININTETFNNDAMFLCILCLKPVPSSQVKLTRRLTFNLTLGQQKRVSRALNSQSNVS